jgi:hypothetical protein
LKKFTTTHISPFKPNGLQTLFLNNPNRQGMSVPVNAILRTRCPALTLKTLVAKHPILARSISHRETMVYMQEQFTPLVVQRPLGCMCGPVRIDKTPLKRVFLF